MNSEDAAVYATAAAVAIVGAVGVTKAVKVMKTEHEKRKKINVWKDMNLECIKRSRDRLLTELEDDNFTLDRFIVALNEERAFLEIVRNQPKY